MQDMECRYICSRMDSLEGEERGPFLVRNRKAFEGVENISYI